MSNGNNRVYDKVVEVPLIGQEQITFDFGPYFGPRALKLCNDSEGAALPLAIQVQTIEDLKYVKEALAAISERLRALEVK